MTIDLDLPLHALLGAEQGELEPHTEFVGTETRR